MTQPQNAAAILAAETKRRSDIRAMFAPHGDAHRDLLDACLDNTAVTPDAASRKLLAALAEGATPTGGLRWSETDRVPDFQAAATDALLQRAGIHVDKPHAGAKDLRRMSLSAMAEACHSMRNGGSASRPGFFATHTSSDFPYLLANTAGKALQSGYENEPSPHLLWTRQVDVADFKMQSRIARSEAPDLVLVGEGAEVPFGSVTERREQYQVQTFGRRFAITRQAIQNDDLGALVDMPRALGQAAKRAEAAAVTAILVDNDVMSDGIALFHADHANLSGSSGSITVANLNTARAALRRQTGPAGGLLNIQPRYLVVPASLEGVAEELIASTSRADHPAHVANPFVQGLTLVVDPRLDDASITAWYLMGHWGQCDTIELGRLEGRGVLVDEEQNFADGALHLRALLDFGVKAIDHRAMYRFAAS